MNTLKPLLCASLLCLSFALAETADLDFDGSWSYQSGMTLEEAQSQASVDEAGALAAAQQLLASSNAADSIVIAVVDGYVVWEVLLDGELVYVDAADASNAVRQADLSSHDHDESEDGEEHDDNEDDSDDDDNDEDDDDDDDEEDDD